MPKFSVESLSPVEYDFTGFMDQKNKPNMIEDQGFVPEPSRELVGQTMKRITEAFKKFGFDEVAEDKDSIQDAMSKIDQEILYGEMTEYILDAVAELCGGEKQEDGTWVGGKPTHDTLSRLGNRAFMGFFNYLMEEMMSPELSKPDTKSSPKRLRSV